MDQRVDLLQSMVCFLRQTGGLLRSQPQGRHVPIRNATPDWFRACEALLAWLMYGNFNNLLWVNRDQRRNLGPSCFSAITCTVPDT